MKQLLLLLALVPALCIFAFASEGDELSGGKTPLDLPAGGLGDNSDDEDAPETIHFFGSEYEGDAFFWCFAAYEF